MTFSPRTTMMSLTQYPLFWHHRIRLPSHPDWKPPTYGHRGRGCIRGPDGRRVAPDVRAIGPLSRRPRALSAHLIALSPFAGLLQRDVMLLSGQVEMNLDGVSDFSNILRREWAYSL